MQALCKRGVINPSPGGQKTEIKYKMWHVTRHKVTSEQAEINECQETRSSKRYYDNKKPYSTNKITKTNHGLTTYYACIPAG